ncbi:MAG: hypothetical protein LUI85_04425 [Bacteroides sp.]|nr:hypothetical protein [Bacteroides sp.]
MTETLPSGIRLKNLIQNHHAEILSREKNNDKFIHLYSIGTYWVAFEQSACRLGRISPQCEISLFRVAGRLDYVVMTSISSDEANEYFRKYIGHRDETNYKVLSVPPLPAGHYYKWHVDVVKSIL